MSKQALKRVRRALKMEVNRQPLDAFAWPGGYPLYYLFADGGVCCPDCANKEIVRIDEEMSEAGRKPRVQCGGYALAGVEANYEDPLLTCDNCGKFIDPAYLDEKELAVAREWRAPEDCP